MLMHMYFTHNYRTTHIWNCDESRAQARGTGGGRVFARQGYGAYILLHQMREWLLILSCINASNSSNPNFYVIFQGRSFSQNFLSRYKEGSCMAMQK